VPDLVNVIPEGFRFHTIIDHTSCRVARKSKDNSEELYIYNYLDDNLSESPLTPNENTLIGRPERTIKLVINSDRDTNTLVDLKTGESREVDNSLGHITAEWGEVLYFNHDENKKISCVNKHNLELCWQTPVSGSAYETNSILEKDNPSNLVITNTDYSSYTDVFLLDRENGNILMEKHFDFFLSVGEVRENQFIIGSGARKIVVFDYINDKLIINDIYDDFSIAALFDNSYYTFRVEETEDVCKDDSPKFTTLYHYDIFSGELVGSVDLSNVTMLFAAFRMKKTKQGAMGVAYSRLSTFENYRQVIAWDENDIEGENLSGAEESLLYKFERLRDGGQSYYRVYIEGSCENFFQLLRQMAVGAWRVAAQNARSETVPEKKCDPEFNGRIIVDVRNHQLTEKEKIAIARMCESIPPELYVDYLVPGCNRKYKFCIEPIVAES